MVELREELFYLKGMLEGLKFQEESKENIFFNQLINFLEKVVNTVEEVRNLNIDLQKYIQEIDRDLGELESQVNRGENFLEEEIREKDRSEEYQE